MEAQLKALGIQEDNTSAYAAKFAEEAVSLDDVREGRIGSAELTELGVKMGDRAKILQLRAPQYEEVPATERQPLLATITVTPTYHGPMCANHPNVPATRQCIQRNCRKNFCLDCVTAAPPRYVNYWCHACRAEVKANALCDCEKCTIL